MRGRTGAVVLAVISLALGGVCGCADTNNCRDQSICGNGNDDNGGRPAESAAGESPTDPSDGASFGASSPTPDDTATEGDSGGSAGSSSEGSGSRDSAVNADGSGSGTPQPSRPRSVSLFTLCQSVDDGFDCGAYSPRTVGVGDRTFTYVGETNPNNHSPDWKIVMGMSSTTCTDLTLRFAAGGTQRGPDEEVRLRLTQEHADAVEARAGAGTIGKLTARIVGGGSFKVEGSASDDMSVVANGTATCTTVSGK
ncbi:hypothetical protein [Streptomyces fagopyri]|uniref:hypothetical protein n=1 Tax=Streptomyces fagopyri TaxID=2662397 RepID=UPI00371194DE